MQQIFRSGDFGRVNMAAEQDDDFTLGYSEYVYVFV